MNLILFDDHRRNYLLPFTHTRPVADIRCGIFTMRERWESLLGAHSSTLTASYLQEAFPQHHAAEQLYVNGGVFGTTSLAKSLTNLAPGKALIQGGKIIAFCTFEVLESAADVENHLIVLEQIQYDETLWKLENIWDIFSLNDMAIRMDFNRITHNRTSQKLPAFITTAHPEQIFIEEGAILNPAIINAGSGPVYIGKNAEIMDGCMIRGPFALCDHAVLKMGTKLYGASTIGPGCKVGGELSNVVFFNNSNKGHDGFLGNAVIGDWCNLGADTNCSNLKNNYDEIRIWSEFEQKSLKTGLQFCGLMMGDHSKCGINTMFNTGTLVGVSCNTFGAGFPPKFIPSFSWGDSSKMETYELEKALNTADRMMARRGKTLSDAEVRLLKHVFEHSEKDRSLLH
jgi:UDP-N-acetylglucosamine diphosphorylase/glucosamine-1-phosphate N-acetyltransferase